MISVNILVAVNLFIQVIKYRDNEMWHEAQIRRGNRNPEGLITLSHHIIMVTNNDTKDITKSTWRKMAK